jgi:hypothetical protein
MVAELQPDMVKNAYPGKKNVADPPHVGVPRDCPEDQPIGRLGTKT